MKPSSKKKRPLSSILRHRASLHSVKVVALRRSASSRGDVVVGARRSFGFVPADAKLEVLSWPKL